MAAVGITLMVAVLIAGTSAVALIAATATVDIPAKTILTTGGCHPLPVLCHMTFTYFADIREIPSARELHLRGLFPVNPRANRHLKRKKALNCAFDGAGLARQDQTRHNLVTSAKP